MGVIEFRGGYERSHGMDSPISFGRSGNSLSGALAGKLYEIVPHPCRKGRIGTDVEHAVVTYDYSRFLVVVQLAEFPGRLFRSHAHLAGIPSASEFLLEEGIDAVKCASLASAPEQDVSSVVLPSE